VLNLLTEIRDAFVRARIPIVGDRALDCSVYPLFVTPHEAPPTPVRSNFLV